MKINIDSLYNEFSADLTDIVDALSMTLPLSSIQLKEAFSASELKELEELLGVVQEAKSENEKMFLLMKNSNLTLKLLSVLGVFI